MCLRLSIFVLAFLFIYVNTQCIHHEMTQNATKHFYNDLQDKRMLQDRVDGRLRIFVDYTQVQTGGLTEINMIKRATNITASYFYKVLNVTRLPKLYYPKDAPRKCNVLTIPQQYVDNGTIGDLGVACGNENDAKKVYVAKSIACAYLESNKRPYWGIMVWNNAFLKYDQEGFQEMVYIGIHEMTHILGFSAVMYDLYQKGSPLIQRPNGEYLINTPRIVQQIQAHFKCKSSFGLPLQDQDGTLIASHWERKVMGNQMMIASNRKSAFTSVMTLALLDSTGWYTNVDYSFAEPTTWGKGQGCNFLDIDNCEGKQFCQDSSFGCDTDGTAIGRCGSDLFTGSCNIIKYYTNTICVDENYELKNLNGKLFGLERGGSNSRCFASDYRQEGIAASKLNNRCYISICSFSRNFMYLLIGSYIAVCRKPGQVIAAPPGLEGTLTCPPDFDQYCKSKKTCPYHCNKNGLCVDGQCLCTGSTQFSSSCVDVSIYTAPVGDRGGLTNNLADNTGAISLENLNVFNATASNVRLPDILIKDYSINSKCLQGTILDEFFGGCLKCSEVFNCQNCNQKGCISCDNGMPPMDGRCPMGKRI